MMKKTISNLVLLALLSGIAPLWAGGVADVGTSWLKIPGSAREAGLAGAFSAVGDDINSLGVNPAGLALIDQHQALFLHDIWIQNISSEHLAYGQPLEGQAGGAVAVDYLNFGSVDQYNLGPSGAPVAAGTYSPMAGNFTLGYGRKVAANLYAGGTVKFLVQNLDTISTFTAAGDLGLLYHLPKTGASFALVLSNLGGNLDTTSLPSQLRMGAAYQTEIGNNPPVIGGQDGPSGPLHLIGLSADGDISLVPTSASSLSLGGEYWYHQQVAVRVGYRLDSYGALDGLKGFCAGIGLRFQKFELSYALTTLGDLGSSHQISLMTRF